MDFEDRLEFVNLRYFNLKVAVIDKRPTHVKVIEVVEGKVSGFFERKSTVHYDGTYKARSFILKLNQRRKTNSL
jgi:penicillin-binding protein-related factor A (putative recombinase)